MKTLCKGWGLRSGFRAWLVVALLSIFSTYHAPAQPSRLGDLDADSKPTVLDLQRLLNHIVPDVVHVLSKGRIVKSGGKELAHELEASGYAQFQEDAA